MTNTIPINPMVINSLYMQPIYNYATTTFLTAWYYQASRFHQPSRILKRTQHLGREYSSLLWWYAVSM